MFPVRLLQTTGQPRADAILEGVIGLYELTFPGRVRGYYLAGSYADGSAVPDSDLDLYVVFRGEPTADEAERAKALRRCCERISPLELELPLRGETRLNENALAIKRASLLVYGEDIRDAIAEPDRATYVRQVTMAPMIHFAHAHGGLPLRFPLGPPDPDGEFFGYEEPVTPTDGGPPWRSVKRLVHVVGWAATAAVALTTGRRVATKSEWLSVYRAEIDDPMWTPFLEAVYTKGKTEWRYRVPDDPADRALLRDLCRAAPGFQNHYLSLYRAYLLYALRSGGEEDRSFAVRRLRDVFYPDAEIADALRAEEGS